MGDRHNWSSLAYQGGGRKIDMNLIEEIKQVSLGDFKADFTLYLDIDPIQGLKRAKGRGELDRIEKQAISFFERSRAIFQSLVENEKNAVLIEAGRKPATVELAICEQLDCWLLSLNEVR